MPSVASERAEDMVVCDERRMSLGSSCLWGDSPCGAWNAVFAGDPLL